MPLPLVGVQDNKLGCKMQLQLDGFAGASCRRSSRRAPTRRVQMPCRADLVARAVIAQFDGLPPKRKPAVRDNGRHEWVPLSGIVAERDGDFVCLALAYAPAPPRPPRAPPAVASEERLSGGAAPA